MPFQSYAQKSYLKHNVPSVYKRWAEEFPNQKNLPKKKNYGENVKKALKKGT